MKKFGKKYNNMMQIKMANKHAMYFTLLCKQVAAYFHLINKYPFPAY